MKATQEQIRDEYDYYADQLQRVQVDKTEYPPTIKVFANGNGENTNNLSLNKDSATALVKWLTANFVIEQYKYVIVYVKEGRTFREAIKASDWAEAKEICKTKGDFVSCITA